MKRKPRDSWHDDPGIQPGEGKAAPEGSITSKTEVLVHNSNDFSGLKGSNDYCPKKFSSQIDKRIESISVEAVKKQLAQRRN